MATSIVYDKLLTVNVFQDYFLNDARLVIPDADPPFLQVDEFGSLSVLEQHTRIAEVKYDIQQTIDIVPTKDTLSILRQQNWIFRPSNTGFFIAAKVNGTALFTPLRQTRKLTFVLKLRDRLFMNYTDLDLDDHQFNSLYHFYNNSNLLSANAQVNNDDRIRLFPNLDVLLETLYRSAPLTNRDLIVTKQYDNTTTNRVMDQLPASSVADYSFTKTIEEGWYQVAIPSAGYAEIVYLSPFHYARKPFGLIEFNIIGGLNSQVLNNGELLQPTYTLSFANRYTRWRYFDASDPSTAIPSIEVDNPDGLLTKPLLKEGYITVFADTIDDIRLPNPSVDNLTVSSGTTYSDTYIKWNG